jgi:hypothetical protein
MQQTVSMKISDAAKATTSSMLAKYFFAFAPQLPEESSFSFITITRFPPCIMQIARGNMKLDVRKGK